MKAVPRFQLPATLGSDLAGVVLEVGHHVTRFKPGDGYLHLPFLDRASVSSDKAPFRSASQAGPDLTQSAKPGWYTGSGYL
jgi:NADPH:quinone reductase-like Zn-dependent oxidoreductase